MNKIILLTFMVASLSACKIQDILPTSSASENQSKKTNITKKSVLISPLNRKKVRQIKRGVSITIEPINSTPELWYKVRLDKGFNLMVLNGQYDYTETLIPYYKKPIRLAFRVKISNNSKRVFRPKNAVLTFNVDSESTSVNSTHYKKLANAIIVPNSSKSFTIYGPKVTFIKKSKGTIHLGMYDVKTENKLSNFEWFFKYKTKKTRVKQFIKKSSVKLTKYEASHRHGLRFKAE